MKLDYCVLGTNNMEEAIQFYSALFAGTTLNQGLRTDRMAYWESKDFAFALAIPFDKQPATNGNGTMLGLNVGTEDEVNRLYEKAMALGGSCEGKPGNRGPKYSAYIRDLDNNKIVFSA
ncbi:VOC family protein [Alteromonas sp. 009811495]|uniref:VOC family protein n=1 Tax=Alteromonas sp. 009811495 TaxID=3002962 RepID=UPI00237E581F|nr:VOC family protein [Alteromonas sp. 009811495]WDT86913.1 VOC family protein [Alteromonas sp. 009811495]